MSSKSTPYESSQYMKFSLNMSPRNIYFWEPKQLIPGGGEETVELTETQARDIIERENPNAVFGKGTHIILRSGSCWHFEMEERHGAE